MLPDGTGRPDTSHGFDLSVESPLKEHHREEDVLYSKFS